MGTQISLRLPELLLRRIDREARKRRVRRSDLVREVLETFFSREAVMIDDQPYNRVRDLAGSLSGGPPDLGERHREYLRDLIGDRR
ncbi:MAG: ribbon-helix-helix protein, CopG family [Candidatus Methylomirabilales bacterium]